MLEDALRETLAARVERAPAIDDPAGVAIQRGRRTQRRRAAGSSVAAVLVLVVALTGIVWLQGLAMPSRGAPSVGLDLDAPATPVGTDPTPGPSSVPGTGLGVDLHSGDRVWTSDGQLVALDGVPDVRRVYRVPTGWVYGGADRVRLMRAGGTSVGLSGQGEAWTLDPAGGRIAFAIGRTLHVARIGATGLAITDSVELAEEAVPVQFLGDRLVLATGTGDARRFGVFDPARPAPPAWSTDVLAVFGGAGGTVTALVRTADGNCLATVAAAQWRPARVGGCALGLRADRETALAPDGRWLAQRTDSGLRLVQLERTLRGRPTATTCRAPAGGPPVWEDDRTVLAVAGGTVTRCGVDGRRAAVPLPAEPAGGWQPIPALPR